LNGYGLENLNEDQINTIHELFNSLDDKSSGELDVKQCIYLFRLLLIPMNNQEQFQLVINQVDFNNNGKISFQEFLILLSQTINNAQNINFILETFKYFDKDNDGIINIKDLSKIFLHLEEKFNEQQLNEMLRAIDYHQDGYVTFRDSIQMTNQLKNI